MVYFSPIIIKEFYREINSFFICTRFYLAQNRLASCSSEGKEKETQAKTNLIRLKQPDEVKKLHIFAEFFQNFVELFDFAALVVL